MKDVLLIIEILLWKAQRKALFLFSVTWLYSVAWQQQQLPGFCELNMETYP